MARGINIQVKNASSRTDDLNHVIATDATRDGEGLGLRPSPTEGRAGDLKEDLARRRIDPDSAAERIGHEEVRGAVQRQANSLVDPGHKRDPVEVLWVGPAGSPVEYLAMSEHSHLGRAIPERFGVIPAVRGTWCS